ncbi:MAG: ABC transporter permease [Acidobacteriota bacterium]|nr:ABC transporter permease [Acidobacteriota bacterium]
MILPSNGVPEFPAGSQGIAIAPAAISPTRPMYWSVQRELWENRSIFIAPLAVLGVVLFGFLISLFTLPNRMHAVLALDAAKSLPVSDRTTVLSKATIPLAVLPLFIFAIVVAAQLFMLLLSTVVLLGSGPGLVTLWTNVKFFQSTVAFFYALIAIALWHAPIYGWLLLVSGWAKRSTFLWATLPFVAISVLEKIAFSTSYFGSLIGYRFIGWFKQFLSTPGLWIGLIMAALFFVAAMRLRHYREPI